VLTVALAATLVVLVFARDISRSAHDSLSPRRSENRTFASMGNVLLGQQDAFDGHLTYLLTNGATLTRPVFAARLSQLDEQLPQWLIEANQIRRPRLAHDINDVLGLVSETRVDAYQSLLASIALALALPWHSSAPVDTVVSTAQAQAALRATGAQWNRARFGLRHEPGRASLLALSDFSALLDFTSALSTLAHSSSLAVTRGIGVSAVSVTPAPLPAPIGELLLPPTSSLRVGVTVSNASYVKQPVSLTYLLTPINHLGVSIRRTMTATLGPLSSYAFVAPPLTSVANERATLTITVAGAPSGPAMSRLRRYTVVISPSGNG